MIPPELSRDGDVDPTPQRPLPLLTQIRLQVWDEIGWPIAALSQRLAYTCMSRGPREDGATGLSGEAVRAAQRREMQTQETQEDTP